MGKESSFLTGSELPLSGDVPERVDVLRAGVLELVHLDVSPVVGLHPGGGQVELGRGRRAPHGPQQAVHAAHSLALLGAHREEAVRALGHLLHVGVLEQVDAQVLHLLRHSVRDQVVERAEDLCGIRINFYVNLYVGTCTTKYARSSNSECPGGSGIYSAWIGGKERHEGKFGF